MDQRRTAPFTPTEVRNLNEFQNSGIWHAFRCQNDQCRCNLVATEAGWGCPQCDHTQDWAHAWMADGTWRGDEQVLKREG
jgi:hypothetical protein